MIELNGLQLDKTSAIPLYEQLRKALLGAITSGKLEAGTKLPTEEELCAQFEISRPVARQAYNMLIEEGFVREIISKVQTMRKEAGFEVTDRIVVYASGNDKLRGIMEKNNDAIKHDVLADDLVYETTDGYVKDWKINGESVTMAVKKS